MEQAWYVAVATAPPLIWLWAFLKLRGKESLAPGWTLLLSVGAGVLVTVPTAMLESILGEAGGDTWALTITGPVEETAKFVAVTAGVMDHRRMLPGILGGGDPERADRQLRRGVLAHTAAASMGFAIAENVGYVSAFGPEAMLLRGPVSTVHHLALGLVWGASLQAHVNGGGTARNTALVALSLALAATLHTGLNLWTQQWTWAGGMLLPLSLAWIGWQAKSKSPIQGQEPGRKDGEPGTRGGRTERENAQDNDAEQNDADQRNREGQEHRAHGQVDNSGRVPRAAADSHSGDMPDETGPGPE